MAIPISGFERLGRTVYGLVAEVAVLLPRGDAPGADTLIADFVTFDAAWDIPARGNVPTDLPPPDAERDAGDRLTLAQD